MSDWPVLAAIMAFCVFAVAGAVWAFLTAKKDDGTETLKDDNDNDK